MRKTIFIHKNCIHLVNEISTFNPDIKDYQPIEYYVAISKEEIYSIRDEVEGFYIKLGHYLHDEMDFVAYKPDMTDTEIQEFRDWCKLNKQGIVT